MRTTETFDLRLKSPFTAIVAGPTGSGKSYLLKRLIDNAGNSCSPPPAEIIYCYGVWQPLFDEMKGVTFHEGLIDVTRDIPRDGRNRWLVIDDLMGSDGDSGNTENLYTKYSHHLNISVFYVVQNLFHKGKQHRTVSLNTHYLFLFKNPRDSACITHLARQIYPTQSKFVLESYQDATKQPYTFLLIDLKQDTDDRLRLRSNVVTGEDNEIVNVYVPK